MIEWNNSTIATIIAKPADNTMIYIFASIMFVGFFGNAKVIVDIFSANKKRRWNFKLKNVTDIFIVNLAFADLSLMLVVAILITKMSVGQWTLGLLACKFYMTFDGVTKFVSVAFIVLLSFDRYLAVCHPLTSRNIRTANFANICALGAWTVVIVLMAPIFVVTKLHTWDNKIQCAIPSVDDSSYSNTTNVSLNDIFMIYNFTLNYFVPLILILFFYIQILFILRKRHQNFTRRVTFVERHSSTKMLRSSSRRQGDARNKRLTLLILFIVLTYTFCWMPYWVLQFSLQFNGEAFYDLLGDEYFPLFSFAAYALQMCNSALNPYFYLASAYLRNVGGQKQRDHMGRVVSKAKIRGCINNAENNTSTTLHQL